MKKIVFFLMATAALFTSCSNDDLSVLSEDNAIKFDGFVNKSTRSGHDVTNETLKNFSVYGFMETVDGQIFDRETVSKEEDGWKYYNTQYWVPGKAYHFSAIAPAYNARWTYEVGTSVKGGKITFANGDGTQDLIYAYTGNVTSEFSTVGFNFNHLLSRVRFSFTNGFDNPTTTLNVKDIKIIDAVDRGSKEMANMSDKWESETTTTLKFGESNNPRIPIYEEGVSDIKYMIPFEKEYTLVFTVEMYSGKELAATYTHSVTIDHSFLANVSYDLNAVLNASNINPEGGLEEIHFNVSGVESWNDHKKGGQKDNIKF